MANDVAAAEAVDVEYASVVAGGGKNTADVVDVVTPVDSGGGAYDVATYGAVDSADVNNGAVDIVGVNVVGLNVDVDGAAVYAVGAYVVGVKLVNDVDTGGNGAGRVDGRVDGVATVGVYAYRLGVTGDGSPTPTPIVVP